MGDAVDDRLIRRMFQTQRVGLLACVPIGLALAFAFMMPPTVEPTGTLGRILVFMVSWLSIALNGVACLSLFGVVIPASFATCCYVYRVGWREIGAKYAITHLLLCLVLLPTLFGPLLMPLLVGNDVERLREETDQSPASNP
jgi:hypothetical protein